MSVLLSGLCDGGPFNGKPVYHAESSFKVGRDRLTKRIIVGYRGEPTIDVEVGHYEYSGGAWRWFSPNA